MGTALFAIALGAFFLVHCARAVRREVQNGAARFDWQTVYKRDEKPVGFWVIRRAAFEDMAEQANMKVIRQ